MNSNWRLPSVNGLTAGTPSLPSATSILFARQRLSPAAMERLEQQAQATQGLLQGTVVPGDLQRMQYTCPNRQPLPGILPTPLALFQLLCHLPLSLRRALGHLH